MAPRFRCQQGHLFERPNSEIAAVTKYEARYSDDFIRLEGEVSAAEVRATALRPGMQNSIEQIDGAALASLVTARRLGTASLFERFFQRYEPDDEGGNEEEDNYRPSTDDRRKRTLRDICARSGQRKFREALFKRYGQECMITGCTLMAVVDAAHIWPYRGDEDNDPANGLLLRSDVHVLYDIDLIGLRPGTLRVVVPPALAQTEYAALDGRELQIMSKHRPSRGALLLRWKVFCEKHGLSDQD